jgi:hypothetical protein
MWNLSIKEWEDEIEFGHTRAITDIDFSTHNTDVLYDLRCGQLSALLGSTKAIASCDFIL